MRQSICQIYFESYQFSYLLMISKSTGNRKKWFYTNKKIKVYEKMSDRLNDACNNLRFERLKT